MICLILIKIDKHKLVPQNVRFLIHPAERDSFGMTVSL